MSLRQCHVALKHPGAGVDRKSMLRLPGHGDAGPGGGPCGDLYIRFRVTICNPQSVLAFVLTIFSLLASC